jgi:hypothetical protein
MAERGEDWLSIQRRTLRDVVELLKDEGILGELIAGGGLSGRRLPLERITVDEEAGRLDVEDSHGREKFISFKAVANVIARLKKASA